MIASKTKIAVAVLSLASAGVWVPQFLQDDTRPPRNGPAGATDEGEGAASATGSGPASAAPVQGASLLGSVHSGSSENASSEEPVGAAQERPSGSSRLDALRNFLASRTSENGEDLDRMASAWTPTGTSAAPESTVSSSQGSAPVDATPVKTVLEELRNAAAEPEDTRVSDYLAAHPLAAILHREDGSAALLGSVVVREGDEIASGLLRVASIEPRRVRLETGELELVLDLPPIQHDRSRRSSFGEEGNGSDESAQDDQGPAQEDDDA